MYTKLISDCSLVEASGGRESGSGTGVGERLWVITMDVDFKMLANFT